MRAPEALKPLRYPAWRVYAALCEAQRKGRRFDKAAQLADAAGVSLRSIYSALRDLRRVGLVDFPEGRPATAWAILPEDAA